LTLAIQVRPCIPITIDSRLTINKLIASILLKLIAKIIVIIDSITVTKSGWLANKLTSFLASFFLANFNRYNQLNNNLRVTINEYKPNDYNSLLPTH